MSGSDRQTAVNSARLDIASILAVLCTATGVRYPIRTYRLAHQKRITDRYTKAVEQLSNDRGAIRIGVCKRNDVIVSQGILLRHGHYVEQYNEYRGTCQNYWQMCPGEGSQAM